MKNSKKVFILTESVLGILVIILAVVMLMGRNGKELHKVSVIVENSDDNQWAAFRYGLRMAAEDQEMEMSVVSTEGTMTLEEQQALAQQEIDNGGRRPGDGNVCGKHRRDYDTGRAAGTGPAGNR